MAEQWSEFAFRFGAFVLYKAFVMVGKVFFVKLHDSPVYVEQNQNCLISIGLSCRLNCILVIR